MSKRCHEAQAVAAFLWFALIAYIVSLITDLIGGGRMGGGMWRSKSRSFPYFPLVFPHTPF